MYANTCWGLLGLAVTFGLAVLGLPTQYEWLSPWFLGAAVVCGVGSIICFGWPLRERNNRDKIAALVVHPIRSLTLIEPQHLIILGLVVAAVGVIWQSRKPSQHQSVPTQAVSTAPASTTGDPFRDSIIAYLTKNGKTTDGASPILRTSRSFQLADASDGRGPFIQHWGEELGPWPTESDGFTPNQLRKSPANLAANPLDDWGLGIPMSVGPGGNSFPIQALDFMSRNEGVAEVTVQEAYIVSGSTGVKREALVVIGGDLIPVSNINPIPRGAPIAFRVSFLDFRTAENEFVGGIPEKEFFEQWVPLDFVIKYNGKTVRKPYDAKPFAAAFDSHRPKPLDPHVTKKE